MMTEANFDISELNSPLNIDNKKHLEIINQGIEYPEVFVKKVQQQLKNNACIIGDIYNLYEGLTQQLKGKLQANRLSETNELSSLLTKVKTNENGQIYINLEVPNGVDKVLLELNALGIENDIILPIDKTGIVVHHFQ